MKFVLLSPLVLLVVQTITAQSVWSNDPTVNTLVCDAENTQSNAQTISDGVGGAIIVWQDFRTTGRVAIYAQRFDALGQRKWTPNGVLIFQADTVQLSSYFYKGAVADGAGGTIICWSAKPMGNLTGVDIFVQKIDASGSPQLTPNGYPICFALGNQFQPNICSDGAGGAIVGWVDTRTGTFNSEIYAQRINSSGSTLWQPTNGVRVCSAFFGSRGLPVLIPDLPGGAIIAWSDGRAGPRTEPYLQKLNATGQRMWDTSGVPPSNVQENKYLGGIVSDGAGGVILGWQELYSVSGYSLVLAQRVNASGVLLWGDDGLLVLDSQPRSYVPRLVSDDVGGAIFAWRDVRDSAATGYDIFSQRLNGQGDKLWNVDGVAICQAPGLQDQISMASSEDGGAAIAWIDGRSGNSTYDIYAQKVGPDGGVAGTINGLAVCNAPLDQLSPSIVSDGTGGGIVAWYDNRSGNLDIYCQQLASVGLPASQSAYVPGPNAPVTFSAGTVPVLTANFASVGTVDTMTVSTFLNVQVSNLTKALARYLDLSANGTGYNVTLTFNYTDQEVLAAGLVNGDANLKLYRNSGSGWELMGGSVDTAANTVTITGVTAFSRWAMRDPTDTIVVNVRQEDDLPQRFALHQNYPNPFNPTTTITFNIPAGTHGHTSLRVYDLLGREVATLVNEELASGSYARTFDGIGLASGVYLYQLTAGNRIEVRKFVLLK